MNNLVEATRFGSGRAVHRIEDRELLLGRGRFTDSVAADEPLFVAFARSPYAYAKLAAVETEGAKALGGVVAVYTGADLVAAGLKPVAIAGFQRADGKDMVSAPKRALAHEFTRFVGEPVVAVVATSREAARDGAAAVAIDYLEMASVVSPLAAMLPGAPVLAADAPDNVCAEMRHGDVAAAAGAFAQAAHRVVLDLVNQRLAPSPLEPRSILASFDRASGRLMVRISSQMPTGIRDSLCAMLPDLTAEQVQVVVGDVGGGFGMKTGIYPEDVVVAHAARALGRNVRWQAERSEDFVSAVHGRDLMSHAELALDSAGKVLALRVRSIANVGAYPSVTAVAIPLLIGAWVSTSIYDIPTIDLHCKAVMTNTAPTGAYRGAGRPEAIYIIERLLDAAARQLKLDPTELRRRNMIRPDQMPYKNPMGQIYDSGRFEQILDGGLALADWHGFEARRQASKANGKLRGRGIATFLEWTGGNVFEERVSIKVSADGMIEIVTAAQAMGQGIATCYAQLAVDVFDVPIERIRIVQGDTDKAIGFGSAGSRSLFVIGSAVQVASERTIEHAKNLAAETLEAAAADIEYGAGRFRVAGTDLGIGLFELAGRQPETRIVLDSTSAVGGPSWPNACHVCEVEIDPETGHVELSTYTSVNDIGRVVNPTIARGQIEGGAVQGIGQALCEEVVYDAKSGQLLTGSFMDYAMPRADIGGVFKTEFDTTVPCLTNLLGVKGVGELGTIGATPAMVNAVIDALDHAGAAHAAERMSMPLTSEKVWRALAGNFDAAAPVPL